MEILFIMAIFIGLMYFMTVRPQKKRMEEQRKMLDALQPGAKVVLNSGLFGTIRAIGDQQMVVELAPGVEVTALKQTVVRTAHADEEEFEFTDAQLEASPSDVFEADTVEAVFEDSLDESDAGAFEASEILTEQAIEAPADEIYQPGKNVIYQPGSDQGNASADTDERPQER